MASTQPDVETVDDTDPRIEYSGSWRQGGVGIEFNGTTRGTNQGGSYARFTFNGSSISVYGTIDHKPPPDGLNPISIYTIDGSAPETFSPTDVGGVLHRQLFYQSPILENKEHVLVVASTVTHSFFWLDYFLISHAASPLPPTCATPTKTKSTSVSKGVIAGVTVGGVVIFALAGAIIWFIFRRKARRRSPSDTHGVHPFNYPNPDRMHPSFDFEQSLGDYPVSDRRPQFTTGSGGWQEGKLRVMARRHSRTPENSYHGLVPGQAGWNQYHGGSPALPSTTPGVTGISPAYFDRP